MARDPFYDTPEWRALRARVRQRDGNRCTVAHILGGACSGSLHVHHIEPVHERPDLRLDEDNCGTSCASHHPQWEALRRAIVARRVLPPCGHKHPYPQGREACDRRRARELGIPLEPELVLV